MTALADTVTLNSVLCDRSQNSGISLATATKLLSGTSYGFAWANIADGSISGVAVSANDKRSLALGDAWRAVNRLTYPGGRCCDWQRWQLPTWQEGMGGVAGMLLNSGNRNGAVIGHYATDMTATTTLTMDAISTGLVNRLSNTQIVGGSIICVLASATDPMFGFASPVVGYLRNTGVFELGVAFPEDPTGQTVNMVFALPLDFQEAIAIEACYRATQQSHAEWRDRAHAGIGAVSDTPGLGGSLRDVGQRKHVCTDVWDMLKKYTLKHTPLLQSS